jgi:hypothetical protein
MHATPHSQLHPRPLLDSRALEKLLDKEGEESNGLYLTPVKHVVLKPCMALGTPASASFPCHGHYNARV